MLLKEKNLLLTERLAARSQRERFLNPYRLRKARVGAEYSEIFSLMRSRPDGPTGVVRAELLS